MIMKMKVCANRAKVAISSEKSVFTPFKRLITRLKTPYLKPIVTVCRACLILLSFIGTAKAELYKYLSEDGVTVLDSHVPARYVKNGYTILSADGRVLEVVPRALTEEEIRARDRMLAAQQQKEKLKQEQKIADQNLLRIYSTPEDVIRARDTKITSIDNFIRTSQGNLQRLESQKRNLESTLANIERAGGTIPEDPLNRIRHVEIRIRTTEREIIEKRTEMKALEKSFATDLQRLKQLYGAREG